MIEVGVQRVERLLELIWIPGIHDHIRLEHAFDDKRNHQEYKENIGSTHPRYGLIRP